MTRHIFMFFISGVLGVAAAAAQYTAYPPPFAPTATLQKADTRFIPGKSVVCFQGSALSLKFFVNGEPTWFSPDLKIRYGGMVVEIDRKAVRGERIPDSTAEQVKYIYPEHPEVTQTLQLQKDGRILAKLSAPAQLLPRCRWQLALIGEFFGGARLQIGEKEFQLPTYKENATGQKLLFDGPAEKIVFFSDIPEKRFSIHFPDSVKLSLKATGGRYGVWLTVSPEKNANSLQYYLTPGTVAAAEDNTPSQYLTKVANYDFWAEDRLRLPDRNQRRNLLSNSSFEQGFASLYFPHGGGVFSKQLWETKPISIDSTDAFAGKSSLRILSDKRQAGLTQNIAVHPVLLTPGTYTVSFYAKTDKPGEQTIILNNLMLPPGSNIWSGKVQNICQFTPDSDWKRFSRTIEIKVPQPHYFTFKAESQTPAVCHIDAIQLEKGSSPSAYEAAPAEGKLQTSAPDNFLESGKKVAATLEITTAQPNTSGTVESIVRDFFGREVRREKHSFRTDHNGKNVIALNFETMPRGIFTVENRYRLSDGKERYEFTRFAVMDFLHNTHKHKNLFANAYIDPFGIRQYYPEVLERYRRIGIGSRAAFANTEELVAREAAKYGIDTTSVMLLRPDRQLTQNMEKPCAGFTILNNIVWYETTATDFRREDYATITLPLTSPDALKSIEEGAARKSRENPWVKVWGAINEAEGHIPEFAHSRFATEERYRQYVELELAAARGLKRGNPDALVGNSSTSCLRSDRFETIDKLLSTIGDRFRYDCFIFHIYREAPEYPDLDADYQTVFALLARHGYKDTPIYSPEGMHWKPYRMPGLFHPDWIDVPWGPLTYDMGHEERLTAAWRARTWLVGLKNANRVKVMNSSTNFWGFEMDCGLTPYANQKISNTLGRLLGNADFIREFRYSAKTRCYLFKDENDRPVAAIWSCDPEVDRGKKNGPELQFAQKPDAELFDLMEVKHEFTSSLRLSAFPLFLRGKAGEGNQLAEALEKAELILEDEPAATTRFTVQPPANWAMTLGNSGKHPFAATVLLNGTAHSVKLSPGKNSTLQATLPAELSTEKLSFESLRTEIRQTLPRPGTYRISEEFAGVLARQADIRIDGAIDDWALIRALPITQRYDEVKKHNAPDSSAKAEFSATVKLAWSPEKLFMLVEVKDAHLTVNEQNRPGNGWRNDSLQIFLDTFADGRLAATPGLGADDWSYGIYLQPGTLKPYVYRHHTPDIQLTEGFDGARPDTLSTDVECAFRKTDDGYRYELAFPIRALRPFKPAAGNALGVGILLNNQNSAAPMPQTRLFWGMNPDPYNTRPALWPLVILTDRNDR